jgi:hypothetical protein
VLHASVTALLEALAAIDEGQIARLDEQLKELARRSPVCWRRYNAGAFKDLAEAGLETEPA